MLHILYLVAASLDEASAQAVMSLTEDMDEPSNCCGERNALEDTDGKEVEFHFENDVLTVGPHSVFVGSAQASYADGRLTIADEAVEIVLVADAVLTEVEKEQFGFTVVEDEELVDA
jgi:hypothetical protein